MHIFLYGAFQWTLESYMRRGGWFRCEENNMLVILAHPISASCSYALEIAYIQNSNMSDWLFTTDTNVYCSIVHLFSLLMQNLCGVGFDPKAQYQVQCALYAIYKSLSKSCKLVSLPYFSIILIYLWIWKWTPPYRTVEVIMWCSQARFM